MNAPADEVPILEARGLKKSFRLAAGGTVRALDGVSLRAVRGTLTALVGPDGAGKTTFLRLATGLLDPDEGSLEVLGLDSTLHSQVLQTRIGYMPQRFGLYEDLSVQENLDLYADLHGVSREERRERYPRLMDMTALGPFVHRMAGRLSGGMKQKLGLACTLVRKPDLLLLDEPTVGVDPLSRRELWAIIRSLVESEHLPVVLSTAYLDEAERCGHVVVFHQGRVLSEGPPGAVRELGAGRTFRVRPPAGTPPRVLQSRLLDDAGVTDAVPRAGLVHLVAPAPEVERLRARGPIGGLEVAPVEPGFEDGFMRLLEQSGARHSLLGELRRVRPGAAPSDERVVEVRDFVKRYGKFVAVDRISFEVRRGEIFGLLGPNGAGKTTTFRTLCGLLPGTSGTLQVAGVDLHRARASARQKIGYVAQLFSLYGQLSVAENLEFFAGAYSLRGAQKRQRIAWAVEQFELGAFASQPAGHLPGGYKKRLAMAVALLHDPEILFLDEPTSGADPLARREFWRRITALAEQGVTVIVTTHFMEEAEYCDHVAILDAGRILAQGTPAEIRRHARPESGREPTMEDAFIAVVEKAREEASRSPADPRGAA